MAFWDTININVVTQYKCYYTVILNDITQLIQLLDLTMEWKTFIVVFPGKK